MNNITPPTKAEMLARLREARAHLEGLIAGLSETQMTAPDAEDGWSIKDVLFHIAAWERLAMERLDAAFANRALDDRLQLANADADQLNAQLYAANRDLPLEEARAIFGSVHQEMLVFVEGMDEAVFSGPILADWGVGKPVWALIGGNTLWHYEEHSEAIARWLES